MKKIKRSLLIIIPFITSLGHSQKMEVKFGNVSKEDLKMTIYEKDTLAKAIVLFDKGTASFYDSYNNYNIKFLKHKRIKIFDKTATEHLEVTIPYYTDGYDRTELVTNIKATTYSLDDNNMYSETELEPGYIYDEQLSDKWHQKKFVFSNVKNGSVLEYKYEFETPFHFNLPDWNFQNRIPTVYSEYNANMIPFYEYVMRTQGISKYDYQNSEVSKHERDFGNNGSYKEIVHTYVLKDIPAFKDESYITSVNDYIIKMDVQLSKIHYPSGGNKEIMSTWPELNKALLKHEHFGKYIKKSKHYVKKLLKEKINLTTTNKQDIAKELISYVKNNYQWNGKNSKYTSQSVKNFIKNGEGNSAEINLFLIALLNQAGIKTEPIILSTRSHGKIPISYPFDNSSNYVIALIHSDTPFLADATEPLLPYSLLPFKCMNEKGLLVNELENPSWVILTNTMSSLNRTSIVMEFNPETLETDIKISNQSNVYISYINRKKFKDDEGKIKDHFYDIVGEVDHVKTYNYESVKKPYTIILNAKNKPEIVGDNIIIQPFLKLPLSKNHLTQKERSYPVDFEYLRNNQYQCTFTVPNNYKINYLPEPYHVNDDLVDINIMFIKNDKVIRTTGNYTFKKSVYVADEYTRIKSYLDDIVHYFNQPILLEKK